MNIPSELLLTVALGIQSWTLKEMYSLKSEVSALKQRLEDQEKLNPQKNETQTDTRRSYPQHRPVHQRGL